MKLERFDFKSLADGITLEQAVSAKVFIPSGSTRVDAPPPPPPPVYNEEDVKTAERDGYKKGFLEGVEDGRKQAESEQSEVDRRLAGMLETFVQSVSPIFTDYSKMVLQVKQDVPKAALAIARKVAGDALDQNAEVVITDIAMRACETMIHEPELTITVHEGMGDALEGRLKQMAAKLPAANHIVILRDPAMPAADCRIEWKHGSLERVTGGLWEQLEKLTANLSAIAMREAMEEIKTLKAQLPDANEPPQSSEKE